MIRRRQPRPSADSGPPQIAQEPQRPLSRHACPECGQRFFLKHPHQLFCKPIHKRAWETRARIRGLQFMPFGIAQRATRNGTRGDTETGKRANIDADMLIARWRDEDKAAGRMTAIDFLRLRYRHGYERP